MIFLKMKRDLKLKGKRKKERKKERKINMNSSGKRKVNWTPQILMDLLRCKREAQVGMKLNKQTRGLWNVQCFGNGTRWAMNTCRCNFLYRICPIELQKQKEALKHYEIT